MSLYPPAIKKLIPPPADGRDPRITARVAILHVDGGNADSLYQWFNGPSGGVESHFFVKKDGTVEQYRDTDYEADANMAANHFAISIETQGYAAGGWTPEQLAAIKALLLWCNTTHGIPLAKCPTWNGSGVGYHVLFEDEWDGRHASCPGPDRIKQFDAVLVPWMAATKPIPAPAPAPKPAPAKDLNVKLIDLNDVSPYVTGPGVKPMQRLLGVTADGMAGPGTQAALHRYQMRVFGKADNVFGPATAEALLAGK